jgi:hypothetical protein
MIVSSIRKLAKHVGISHVMLSRHFAKGKFKQEPGGGFDVDKVKAALARSADPSQPPRQAGRDQALTEEIGMSVTAYEIFNRARAASAITVAKERQLNLKKRQGELIEEADIRRVWTAKVTMVENRLRQIPDIIAPRVAVMDDILEIRAQIAKEIDAVLRTLYESEADVQ